MKINEVEQMVGITKKNIRFYEQEGLLSPGRNLTNGYREYSAKDVEVLQQIKLLRKLEIPIEEIRKLQANDLTLEDSLKRHLIALGRKRKNLEDVEAFCIRIATLQIQLPELETLALLEEIESMEKGGVQFMDIKKWDKKKQKNNALISVCVIIFICLTLAALILWANTVEPIPSPILFLLLFPIVIPIIGALLALKERFSEIEGGELDEASKY